MQVKKRHLHLVVNYDINEEELINDVEVHEAALVENEDEYTLIFDNGIEIDSIGDDILREILFLVEEGELTVRIRA